MRHWRTVGTAGAVLLAGALLLAAGNGGAAVAGPASQQSGGDALLRELAELLLVQPYDPSGGTGRQFSVELLPGQQPSTLPLQLPIPPGGRLIGSAIRRTGERVISSELVVTATGAPDQAVSYYDRAMQAIGWREPGIRAQPVGGGFQSPQPTSSTFYCGPADTDYLTVSAFQVSPERAALRFTLTTPTPLGAGMVSPTPCGAPVMPVVRSAPSRLPTLTPPSGLSLSALPIPPSGPPNRINTSESSAASTTSTQPPAELERYFAEQLAAAGWTRREGRAEEPLAWSTWQLPGGEGWQGFLMVLASGAPNDRFLYVRAAGEGDAASVPGAPASGVAPAPMPGFAPASAPAGPAAPRR